MLEEIHGFPGLILCPLNQNVPGWGLGNLLLFFKLVGFVFKAVLGLQQIERKKQRYPTYALSLHKHTSSPMITTAHQSGTFITKDRHHNRLKPIVYLRAHSCCCTFYGFGQMYNDMYLLSYHTEYFHCPKNLPCST